MIYIFGGICLICLILGFAFGFATAALLAAGARANKLIDETEKWDNAKEALKPDRLKTWNER